LNPYLPSTLSVTAGKELFVGGALSIGSDQGGDLVATSTEPIASQSGSLGGGATVDGLGASAIFGGSGGGWVVGDDLTLADDADATLTIQNGSVVEIGTRNLSSSNGEVVVVASADADVVVGGSAVGTHAINIDGAASQLDIADDLFIGGTKLAAGGQATVTLNNDGQLTVGDTITIWEGSTLDAQNGIATFATLDVRGLADFGAQTFAPQTGGFAIAMNGGTLRADLVDFENLPLNGSGIVEAAFTTQGDVTATGDLTLGDAADFNGVSIGGTLNVGANTVTLNKAGFFALGNDTVATVAGSRVVAANGFQLPAGAVFSGQGSLQGRVASSTGSLIIAEGGLAIGDALSPAGVFLDGELDIDTHTVTLNDANDAVLGSLTTMGDGAGTGGVIIAQNGVTLGFGRNLVGEGNVLTPNDPFKPFINNGNVIGDSPSDPITLAGYVKGVGTLDNVVITGTDAPGLSPATVYRGSVAYQGTLEIELGGLPPGTSDRVIHSGVATLGGTIDLKLINGFTPALYDRTTALEAGEPLVGVFGGVEGIALGTIDGFGAGWAVTYGETAVELTA
ncbi:MAG: hypothetical protein AAF078_12660, partial [Planctomycetota bacterium]